MGNGAVVSTQSDTELRKSNQEPLTDRDRIKAVIRLAQKNKRDTEHFIHALQKERTALLVDNEFFLQRMKEINEELLKKSRGENESSEDETSDETGSENETGSGTDPDVDSCSGSDNDDSAEIKSDFLPVLKEEESEEVDNDKIHDGQKNERTSESPEEERDRLVKEEIDKMDSGNGTMSPMSDTPKKKPRKKKRRNNKSDKRDNNQLQLPIINKCSPEERKTLSLLRQIVDIEVDPKYLGHRFSPVYTNKEREVQQRWRSLQRFV